MSPQFVVPDAYEYLVTYRMPETLPLRLTLHSCIAESTSTSAITNTRLLIGAQTRHVCAKSKPQHHPSADGQQHGIGEWDISPLGDDVSSCPLA
jgi:hypothetical protein